MLAAFEPKIKRIIIGSDRRPETKQRIEGKIVRFRSGRVSVRDKDRRSEHNTVQIKNPIIMPNH